MIQNKTKKNLIKSSKHHLTQVLLLVTSPTSPCVWYCLVLHHMILTIVTADRLLHFQDVRHHHRHLVLEGIEYSKLIMLHFLVIMQNN